MSTYNHRYKESGLAIDARMHVKDRYVNGTFIDKLYISGIGDFYWILVILYMSNIKTRVGCFFVKTIKPGFYPVFWVFSMFSNI